MGSGLIVFVVCLTSAILVFEVEIEEAFHAEKFYAEKTSMQRLTVDELLEKVKKVYPGRPLQRIEVDHDQMRAVRIEVGEPRTIVFINPYDAQILGTLEYDKRFFTIVLKLHRYLLAGETGKTITGIAVVIFIIMLLSGIILWLPRNKKAIKQSFQIKRNAWWRRINYDVHSVLGFYSMLLLLIIALTGTVWSFKFVNNAIYWLADGKLPDKTKVNSVHTISEAPLKYAAMQEKPTRYTVIREIPA